MRSVLRWSLLALLVLGASLLLAYWLAPGQLLDLNFAAEAWSAGVETRSVEVDGQRWQYAEGGQGEPVLLVHGMAGSKENWYRTARYLGRHYRVIIPDQLGFGASPEAADGDYRIPQQARRLAHFAAALGIRRFHLVGHSMGGAIAGWYATRHPGQVQTLSLIDSAGVRFQPNAFTDLLERGENPFATESLAKFDAFIAMTFEHPPFAPTRLRAAYARRMAGRAALWNRIVQEVKSPRSRYLLEPRLKKIAAPTLVIWCRRDQLIDVSAVQVFRRELPAAEIEILDGCGHMPMMEQPRVTGELLLRQFGKARF